MRNGINKHGFSVVTSLGENFDRQASFRCSASNTDTIIRRPKRVQRRKTITGVPDKIQTELGVIPIHCCYHIQYIVPRSNNVKVHYKFYT